MAYDDFGITVLVPSAFVLGSLVRMEGRAFDARCLVLLDVKANVQWFNIIAPYALQMQAAKLGKLIFVSGGMWIHCLLRLRTVVSFPSSVLLCK